MNQIVKPYGFHLFTDCIYIIGIYFANIPSDILVFILYTLDCFEYAMFNHARIDIRHSQTWPIFLIIYV